MNVSYRSMPVDETLHWPAACRVTGSRTDCRAPAALIQDASTEGRRTVRTGVVPRWIVCAEAEFCEF
jgi:hypothetical protein